ncbi:efflux transporter periplasmic adaptor subunit [Marivirga lumbricoides]|uniref:Efflux transporter periplasmic adaptor subunit n=1 Tax=Marivirga lumbricoides TaxID=1046115 RepID=A0A2T4DS24_9BACT|nr:efflux transporter periplasmic adaptor subunit [Marivirga lumbricoides]
MKLYINKILSLLIVGAMLLSCSSEKDSQQNEEHIHEEGHADEHHDENEESAVHLSSAQFDALDMRVDTLRKRNIFDVVAASGQLEVPPQNEAVVTAVMGANISSILVIEGEEVKKGQVLAYLQHPSYTNLQGEYLQAYNDLGFLEQDYERQKKLYEQEVGSGKTFQQTASEYKAKKGMVSSMETQLKQLGLRIERIKEGDFYTQIPVISPIDGAIIKVDVKLGQYVNPEKTLFEIINTHHIHADLMVFEKDISKVEVGQKVRFTVENVPDEELVAEIYSVGKKFEQAPKAVHVHAEIKNETGKLIPGMYIRGEILTGSKETYAFPEDALVREGDRYFVYEAIKEGDSWMFIPVEVTTGVSHKNWATVRFLEAMPEEKVFAYNNAYYLQAEMNKSEAGHSH